MKRWKKYAAGLVLTAGLSSQVHAQAVAPAAPAAAVPAAAAAPAAPAPANLWTFLCLSPEQKAACKEKLCNSALGQMLNNGLKPMSTFSGGLIPGCCPEVKAADLAKPADSAEGAAARAKADEAAAKERREAVRFLGTVDCHYWPEAQEALINALRGDRNECVRLEAALALNRGCCCTKMIIKALVICVSGSDEDGFPTERSERVRGTAHAALVHCLACYTEVVVLPPEDKKGDKEPVPPPKEPVPIPRGTSKPAGPPEKLPINIGQPATPAEYYHRIQSVSRQQIIDDGQHILGRLQAMPIRATALAPAAAASSPNSLFEIIGQAFSGPSSTTVTTTVVREIAPPPAVAMRPTPAPVVMETMPVMAKAEPVLPPAVLPTPMLPPAPKPTPVVEKAPTLPTPAFATKPAPLPPPQPAPQPTIQPVQTTEKVAPVRATPTASATNNGMTMTLAQVIGMLHDSPYPEYRIWAADNLSTVDGWTNPDVLHALSTTARLDQNAAVRANCVHSLGKMRCGTMAVLSAVQAAKADPDARVRQEAELALQTISGVENAGLMVPSGR